jgi:hypothetical protein
MHPPNARGHILHPIPDERAELRLVLEPVRPHAPEPAGFEPDSIPELPFAAHTELVQHSMPATLLRSWRLPLDSALERRLPLGRERDLLHLQVQWRRVGSVAGSIEPRLQRRRLVDRVVPEVSHKEPRQDCPGKVELDTVLQVPWNYGSMRDDPVLVSAHTLRDS